MGKRKNHNADSTLNGDSDEILSMLREMTPSQVAHLKKGLSEFEASMIKKGRGRTDVEIPSDVTDSIEAINIIIEQRGNWQVLSRALQNHGATTEARSSLKSSSSVAEGFEQISGSVKPRRLRKRKTENIHLEDTTRATRKDAKSKNTGNNDPINVADTPICHGEEATGFSYAKPNIEVPVKKVEPEKALILSEIQKASKPIKPQKPKADDSAKGDLDNTPLANMSMDDLAELEKRLHAMRNSKLDKMMEEQNKLLEERERKRKAEEIIEKRKQESRTLTLKGRDRSDDLQESQRENIQEAGSGVGLPKAPPSSDALALAESFGLDISGLAAEIQQKHGHRTRSGHSVTVKNKKRGHW